MRFTRTRVRSPACRTDTLGVTVNDETTRMHPVMRWLAGGIPLSLLLDLASPDGPDSRAILRTEPVTPRVAARARVGHLAVTG